MSWTQDKPNTNLLEETLLILKKNNLTRDNVVWVGSKNKMSSFDYFADVAKKINYYNGHGPYYIPLDLVVVGIGWWLERREYDGAEGWIFKTAPVQPNKAIKPTKLLDYYE